jgi:hypothetical protein
MTRNSPSRQAVNLSAEHPTPGTKRESIVPRRHLLRVPRVTFFNYAERAYSLSVSCMPLQGHAADSDMATMQSMQNRPRTRGGKCRSNRWDGIRSIDISQYRAGPKRPRVTASALQLQSRGPVRWEIVICAGGIVSRSLLFRCSLSRAEWLAGMLSVWKR